ncbi:AbrB/MazE/SpoVT family DNA-binding domain-containing protein [Candidatus Woesearchaeota archaeon]|nr:AbrB/MazE/SpoVT family DNA-binding domain-containing protein [Candidatus Woesearchaeota archaeon]
MKRKVIQLAGKTLVVSLPSKWAKKLGIKKGDELEIEEKFDKLVATARKSIDIEKTSIMIKQDIGKEVQRWAISAIQKSGYDEIEILYETQATAKIIQDLVKEVFVGFAITEQSGNRTVIRSIAQELESEFDTILRRAFLVTMALGEGITDYLGLKKKEELKELLALEQTNNQLCNFCERMLNKKGFKDYRKTTFAYVIVWNLEKICDTYKEIIHEISQSKEVDSIEKDLIAANNRLLRTYYELYYKFDYKKLQEAMGMKQDEKAKRRVREGSMIACLILRQIDEISNLSATLIAINA